MIKKHKTAKEHLLRYRPLIHELVIRDLKVKYRRSFLGYLWSLLNPLLMMTVMAVVFSHIFRANVENYPLYLICGQTLFSFFTESTNMSMYAILNNAQLIKKSTYESEEGQREFAAWQAKRTADSDREEP